MKSPVSEVPAAHPTDALKFFETRLTYETDCWDTHEAMSTGKQDFILLDVRSPALYEKSHIPGAINLPHGKIIKRTLEVFPKNSLFVVYCAGPHCNGANKAAIRLAKLGRTVKEMIGGMTGWADEGFSFVTGCEPGNIKERRK